MGSAWCEVFPDGRPASGGRELQALGRAGVAVRPRPAEGDGPGLILFEQAGEPLYAHVRDVSREGAVRILAIARSSRALAPGVGWRLLQAGASDVVDWEGDAEPAETVRRRLDRWQAVDKTLAGPLVRDHLIGESAGWRSLLRQVVEIACFTDASVLVTGESGTGKELIARLIHTLDRRPDKRELVVLDCTTVVPELAGSEFFGHERGAFTGAVASRDGAFVLADGGTLFLDEVGELPLPLQGQLLRAVQEHMVKRVGGNTWRRSEFRLVCATNRDLVAEVRRGAFRSDFY
jgi:DNA-binding NtrC family response regulator